MTEKEAHDALEGLVSNTYLEVGNLYLDDVTGGLRDRLQEALDFLSSL